MLRQKEHNGRYLNGCGPTTAGTATTSRPTSCSTTCNATATTTPTRRVAAGAAGHGGSARAADRLRRMILLALFPPLWYRTMDPRVLARFDGDVQAGRTSSRASATRCWRGIRCRRRRDRPTTGAADRGLPQNWGAPGWTLRDEPRKPGPELGPTPSGTTATRPQLWEPPSVASAP